MNKKGFTLVEILAVTVILALIMVLVATNGFGVFDNAKSAINKENEKAIIEGAKVLMIEIENCDEHLLEDIKKVLEDTTIECDHLKNKDLDIKLSKLIEYDYVTNSGVIKVEEECPNAVVTYSHSDEKYTFKCNN